jgi:hypothetical protein
MTPEELVEQLNKAIPGKLRSALLYGSAAAGDFVAGSSTYNVLLVVAGLGLAELDAISKPVALWAKARHRPPLLFEPGQLQASADAFPIELLDIQQWHRLLWGEDPLASVTVNHEHLRLQLERELKTHLITLREHYLLTGGDHKRVIQVLTSSLAGFLVLFRAALRLFRPEVPAAKLDAVHQLAEHIAFDPQPLLDVHDLKHGRRRPGEFAAPALFQSFLKTVEQVVEAVDRHLHPPTPGSLP